MAQRGEETPRLVSFTPRPVQCPALAKALHPIHRQQIYRCSGGNTKPSNHFPSVLKEAAPQDTQTASTTLRGESYSQVWAPRSDTAVLGPAIRVPHTASWLAGRAPTLRGRVSRCVPCSYYILSKVHGGQTQNPESEKWTWNKRFQHRCIPQTHTEHLLNTGH